MKLLIGEAAKLGGVTVRALHHYDRIGLLTPGAVGDSGYRYYGEAEMERLQRILFYRELGFSLREIAGLLQNGDREEALRGQKHLLTMQRDRLDRLIALLDDCLKGESVMDFTPFDRAELEQEKKRYEEEVRERWGKTDAYAQSREKAAGRSSRDNDALQRQTEAFFAKVAALREEDPAGKAAQELVREWQAFLTEHYYDCTTEILRGLGQMYTADERFTANLDRNGAGTAAFFAKAIEHYCAE